MSVNANLMGAFVERLVWSDGHELLAIKTMLQGRMFTVYRSCENEEPTRDHCSCLL